MRSLLVCSMWFFMACGTEYSRRSFPVEISGTRSTLVTDSGWSVTLTKATAQLTTLRFFEGKVLASRHRNPWWRSMLVSEAWAHPGHYIPGEAMAELLTPIEVDLLATEPTSWGLADGITGGYGSVEVGFGSNGVQLEGTATSGSQTVPFSMRYAPASALEGVRFEHEMATQPGTVRVQLDLGVELSRVDFSKVGASALPVDEQSPAFNGFARGVVDISGYLVTWKEN